MHAFAGGCAQGDGENLGRRIHAEPRRKAVLVSSRKDPAVSGPPSLQHSTRIRRLPGYTSPKNAPRSMLMETNGWFLPSKKPLSAIPAPLNRHRHVSIILACMLSQGGRGACSYTKQYPAAAHRDLTPPTLLVASILPRNLLCIDDSIRGIRCDTCTCRQVESVDTAKLRRGDKGRPMTTPHFVFRWSCDGQAGNSD